MFLTFNTFRQAAWSPDMYSTGIVSSQQLATSQYSVFGINGGTSTHSTTTTTTGPGTTTTASFTYFNNTTFADTVTTAVTKWTNQVAQSVMNSPLVTASTVGTSASVSSVMYNFVVQASTSGEFAFLSVVSQRYGTTCSSVSTVTVKGPLGTTGITSTLFFSTGLTITRGFAGSTTLTGQTSTTGSSSSASTTSGTTAGFSSTISTVTTTVASVIADAIATSNSTGTFTRWTVAGGHPTITTATHSVTTTTFTTAAFTFNSTTTITASLPSWWGWNMEIGTVLLATCNTATDDLPAWLVAASFTGSVVGLWNFTFWTQTTLWPSQPTGSAFPVTQSHTTALPSASSIPLFSTTPVTLFGTSAFSATTSAAAVIQFSDSTDPNVSTAGMPLSTQAQTVTSFDTFTATTVGTVLHPLNTSTSTTTTDFGPVPVTRFFGPSFTMGNSPQFHGSLISTFTVTTMIAGYTTASVASMIGPGQSIVSTKVVTAPNVSLTTTTATQVWFYDSSCPTATCATTSTSASGSSTVATNASTLPGSTTASSSSGGTSAGFTQNRFFQPYAVFGPRSQLVSPGVSAVAPPCVATWQATPLMQGFRPWTQTSLTYTNFFAPGGISALAFLRVASGTVVSFDAFGRAVTTTATGLWGIAPQPVTSIFSTTATTAAAPGTTSVQGVRVDHLSYGYTNGDTTVSIKWPANGDETAGSFYSTIGTVTGSGTGFSFPGSPVTSTFCESIGFSGTIFATSTVTSLTQYTFTFLPSSASFVDAGTVNPVVTITQQTTAGATFQNFAGIGGFPKFTGGAATINCIGAAISLWGTGSTTWSSADPNFFQVVIGGSFTTTSSATSSLAGAGTWTIYTIPGAASMVTSPAFLISTTPDRYAPQAYVGTNFWGTPGPALNPQQMLVPAGATPGS